MNKHSMLVLALIVFCSTVSIVETFSTTCNAGCATLVARPVVFIEWQDVFCSYGSGQVSEYHEWADLQERYKISQSKSIVRCDDPELDLLGRNAIRRYLETAKVVAKNLGACAVNRIDRPGYYHNDRFECWVDPEYNITDRVLDILNKKYDAECLRKKRLKS